MRVYVDPISLSATNDAQEKLWVEPGLKLALATSLQNLSAPIAPFGKE